MASKPKAKGKPAAGKSKKMEQSRKVFSPKPKKAAKQRIARSQNAAEQSPPAEEILQEVETQKPLDLSGMEQGESPKTGISQTPFEQAPPVSTPILDKAFAQQREEEEKARRLAALDGKLGELSGMGESMAIITLQNSSAQECAELKQRIAEIKSVPESDRTMESKDLFMLERAFEVVEGKTKPELPPAEQASDSGQKPSLFDGMKQAVSGLFSSLLKPKGKSDKIEPIAPD